MARRKGVAEETPPVDVAVAENKAAVRVEDDRPILIDSAIKAEPGGAEVVYEFEPESETAATGPKEPDEAKQALGDGTPAKGVTDAEKVTNLQKALKEERGKRRGVLVELEETRARLRQMDTTRKQQEEETRRAERDAKLDEAADIKEALPHITEAVRADLDPYIASARRAAIKASERVSRLIHEDYDEVLEKSGVQRAITIDPATGTAQDPVMWNMLILKSDDPAEDAYNLGLELLEQQGSTRPATKPEKAADEAVVLDTTRGDRTDGRREVLETISHNASRPRGIGNLPAAEGRVVRRLTSDVISKMPDEEYARLPKHIREAYLAGGQL